MADLPIAAQVHACAGRSSARLPQTLLELPEVLSVHDLHAWTVTSSLPILSAHVVIDDRCIAEGAAAQVLDHLQECLAGHFDVEHSTLQLEPSTHAGHERAMHD